MDANATVVVTLSRDDFDTYMKQAALIGAQVAAEEIKKEYERNDIEKKERKLHNTKLLLRHYRDFKSHVKEAVYSSSKVDSEELIKQLMSMRNDDMVLESVQRSTVRTQMLIEHIDKMMSVFQLCCERAGDRERRQFDVIQGIYIAEQKRTIQSFSEEYSVSRVTIHNDLKSAEEKLSILFFGMDGLHL